MSNKSLFYSNGNIIFTFRQRSSLQSWTNPPVVIETSVTVKHGTVIYHHSENDHFHSSHQQAMILASLMNSRSELSQRSELLILILRTGRTENEAEKNRPYVFLINSESRYAVTGMYVPLLPLGCKTL